MITRNLHQTEFLPNVAETYDLIVKHRKEEYYDAWDFPQ